ncbi:NAD-dependent epimerase/dehydratase family protein [Hyphococcus sp.]|uniref:NAD-dependent epimerase/dehydratase family protein n=1 Tax=Hyphococcus sp. TaxID=2038636 RepID=UPI003CCBF419
MSNRAAVTGGTGFVGAALIERLSAEGWSVSALARDPSKISARPGVNIVQGALDDERAIAALADGADVFFHLAGLTHARTRQEYREVNVTGAERAAHIAGEAGAAFVHASSMSARKPEVSPYAQSKRDSETALAAASRSNWIALRLPAIYGPRDKATLPYFKMIKAGFALEPKTPRPARASILYVDDAAGALIAAGRALQGAAVRDPCVLEVGDEEPHGRAWSEIGAILAEVFGKNIRPIRVPRPAIASYHSLLRSIEGVLGRAPSVREGQINEFFHADWVARDNLLSDACGWRPQTPLKEGFAKTVRWYQEHDLL